MPFTGSNYSLPFRIGSGTTPNANVFPTMLGSDLDDIAKAINQVNAVIQPVPPSGDTSGATDVSNINAALTAASNNGVRTVRLARGTYTINSSILMKYSNVDLIGYGDVALNNNTVINSTFNGPAILVQTANAPVQGWSISEIEINTPSVGNNATCITVDSSQYGYISNMLLNVTGQTQIGLNFSPSQIVGGVGVTASFTRTERVLIGVGPAAIGANGLAMNRGNNLANAATIGPPTLNTFIDTEITLADNSQTGIYLGICDTNTFINTNVFGPGGLKPTILAFDYGAEGAVSPQRPCSNVFFSTDFGFGIDWTSPTSRIINLGTPQVFGAPNVFFNYGCGDGAVAVALANVEYFGQRLALVGTLGRVGYTVGAGSQVAQTSSITTAVTINNICGQITTVSNSFTAGTGAAFTVNNNIVQTNDVIICNQQGGASNAFNVFAWDVANNSFQIGIYPFSTVTTSIVINFAIIKAVSS